MAAIPDSSLLGHQLLHEQVVAALETCHESRGIEFKRSATWNNLRDHIARTAMAMSNLRDGGTIIIGIDESQASPVCEGIQPQDLATYDDVTVNDWINTFASPTLRISLVRVPYEGREFLALNVPEFESTPTVCRRQREPTFRAGQIYIRPNGKPESRMVRDASEMHDLLELAAEKRARRFLEMASRLGMKPPDDAAKAYDDELEGL